MNAWGRLKGPPMADQTGFGQMRVHLHLGAHFTDAALVRAAMSKALVQTQVVVGEAPHALQAVMQPRLAKRRAGAVRLVAEKARRDGAQKVVFIDAGALGPVPCAECGLYPQAGAHMDRIHEVFARQPLDVSLTMRDYASFWTDALIHHVQLGGAFPKPDLLDRLVTHPRRWRHVIEDIAYALPAGANFRVWAYETAPGDVISQISALLGKDLPNPSAPRVPQPPSRADLRAIALDRGLDPVSLGLEGDGPTGPFTALHLDALHAEYREDLTWLRSGACAGVTYVEGASAVCETAPQRDERMRLP